MSEIQELSKKWGFHLLSFKEIDQMNNKEKYEGLELKFHMTHNLYLRISCQNESRIFKDGHPDVIYFSWCTQNDFPIYSISYQYSKDAYYSGMTNIFHAAEDFRDAFMVFAERSTIQLERK